MNLQKLPFLIVLGFALGSFDSVSQIYGQEIPESSIPPLSVQTELPIYTAGSTVKLSGQVKSLNENFVQPVIIRIFDEGGKMIVIGQVSHDEQGNFDFQTTTGGTWKNSGEYKIVVNYGAQEAENTFEFTGGEDYVAPPPTTSSFCGPNEVLVGGECIAKQPVKPPTKCGSNQILVNGECIDREPVEPPPRETQCGPGEELVNGKCVVKGSEQPEGNGCLIATAAFGTELAPQVQFLREIRENTILSTSSGTSFMIFFNQIYYTFSPTIADWERENPVFKEAVKLFITPMISTLSIMTLANEGSEEQVLSLGISVIALNLGMYFIAPAVVIVKFEKLRKKSVVKKIS